MKAIKYLICVFLLTFQTISAQNFWHNISGNLGDVEVTNLCLTNNGILLAYVEWLGLYYTTNNGELWIETNYQGNEPNAIETVNDSIFIAGGYTFVKVSTDTGKTWLTTEDIYVSSLYFEPINQIVYLGSVRGTGGICGIYTSNDFGQNWTLLYQFPPSGLTQSIGEIHVTRTSQVILAYEYIGSSFGVVYLLHQSTDHGQTWPVIYQSSYTPVTSILEDEYFNLYALAGNKLFDSSDEGQTWIIKDVPNSRVLAADNSGRIYLDLRYSTDQGCNWTAMPGSGFEGAFNDAIAINQNNRIYAASTQGIFYAEADSIVVSIEDIEPAKTFFLFQNYPNPFNPATKIKYEIPDQVRNDSRLVTLKVYDVLGNEIASLVNEEKQPGTYEVEFDGTELQSGIYFYQLKAGNYIETKKMVLIK